MFDHCLQMPRSDTLRRLVDRVMVSRLGGCEVAIAVYKSLMIRFILELRRGSHADNTKVTLTDRLSLAQQL